MITLGESNSNKLSELRESTNLLEKLILQLPQFPTYANQPQSTLYHNTKFFNLESILQHGILLDKARFSDYEGNGIWTTSTPGAGYGGVTIAFNSTDYDLEKVNSDEYRVWEDIALADILFADFPILNSTRLSEIPELFEHYGREHVMRVIKKNIALTGISYETIERILLKFRKG